MDKTQRRPEPRLVDDRNRVCLPRAVLRALSLAAGDFVAMDVTPEGVSLRKVTFDVAKPAAAAPPTEGD